MASAGDVGKPDELTNVSRMKLQELVAQREQELESKRKALDRIRQKQSSAAAGTPAAPVLSAAELLKGVQESVAKAKSDSSKVVTGTATIMKPQLKAPRSEKAQLKITMNDAVILGVDDKPKFYERSIQVEVQPKDEKADQRALAQDVPEERDIVSHVVEEVKPEDFAKPSAAQEEKPSDMKIEIPPDLGADEIDKILTSDRLLQFLDGSTKVVEKALNTARTVDIFRDYAEFEDTSSQVVTEGLTEAAVFEDLRYTSGRCVTSLAQSPKFNNLFLSTHGSRNEVPAIDPDGVALVWAFENPSRPEYIFSSPSAIQCSCWNPDHPNLILGGTYGGSIVQWDLRAKSRPVLRTTTTQTTHNTPVVAMFMLGSQHSQQLLSIDEESRACLWSVSMALTLVASADLKPPKKLDTHTDSGGGARRLVTLCSDLKSQERYSGGISSTVSFYGGTEDGSVYEGTVGGNEFSMVNFFPGEGGAGDDTLSLGANPGLGGGSSSQGLPSNIGPHSAPVTSMHWRSPVMGSSQTSPIEVLSDTFLTSSADWSLKLWCPSVLSHPMYTFERGGVEYIWDVKWSPTHPAVFASVDAGGVVDMWNLCDSFFQPVKVHRVTGKDEEDESSAMSLNKLQWLSDGKLLSVGGSSGAVNVFRVAASEAELPSKEALDRLDAKMEELKARAAQTAAGAQH